MDIRSIFKQRPKDGEITEAVQEQWDCLGPYRPDISQATGSPVVTLNKKYKMKYIGQVNEDKEEHGFGRLLAIEYMDEGYFEDGIFQNGRRLCEIDGV